MRGMRSAQQQKAQNGKTINLSQKDEKKREKKKNDKDKDKKKKKKNDEKEDQVRSSNEILQN